MVTLTISLTGISIPIPSARAGEVVVPVMPIPGTMVNLSPAFTPAHLQGITIHSDNALKFDFLVRTSDDDLSSVQKEQEYIKLIKYFMASLTVADKDQWVNLSPYENDRIIETNFGKTAMGRDLLTQDYLLKQITSSLMYPERGLGKKFWDKVYERAFKEYGSTNIPVNTFNKVWIVPDQADVYEGGNTVYILRSRLKVMLEEDYLAGAGRIDNHKTRAVASKVIREVILPLIEKEVNEGKNFASLRQIYTAMILAAWYKKALRESLLGQIYADQSKIKGIDQDPKANEIIYQTYLAAFKKGVYNYIKEDEDKYTKQMVHRKYFAGGFLNITPGKVRIFGPDSNIDFVPDGNDLAMASFDRVSVAIDGESAGPAGWSQDQKKLAGLIAKARQAGRVPNVLNICTGNLNRSALMEMSLKELAVRAGVEVNVHSGGTLAWTGRMEDKVGDQLRNIFNAHGPVRGTRMEKLLKAIAFPEKNILNQRGAFTGKGLSSEELVAAFRNFDKDVVVAKIAALGLLEDYMPLVDRVSIAFKSMNQYLSEMEIFNAKAKIMSAAQKGGIRDEIRDAFRPQIVTPAAVRTADIIIAADAAHVKFIKKNFPGAEDKTVLLKQLPHDAQLRDPNLPDPQTGAITENALFEEIVKLMRDAVLPLFGNLGTDAAMIGHKMQAAIDGNKANYGGIDFSSANLAMNIKRDGKGVPFPIAQQDMAQLSQIQGFVPTILEIKPNVVLPIFSELRQKLQSQPA